MASGRKSRKQRLTELLRQREIGTVGDAEWCWLRDSLAPVRDGELRRLLRASGMPVLQPFAGVDQQSFESLEQSLRELEQVYSRAMSAGDRLRARQCRRAVIEAKDHARLVARNPRVAEEKRKRKLEMVDWMIVWLENPPLFPAWVELRKPRLQP